MERGFVYEYLAGVDFPGYGDFYGSVIPMIPLGRWQMGLAVILCITGICLSRRRQISVLEMVRFGGRKGWWNAQFRKLLLVGASACFCYGFCMKGMDLLFRLPGERGTEELLIFLLWSVHMMTMMSIFCLSDLTAFRHLIPAALFVTEVSTFTVGFYHWHLSKFMFGNWGMYVWSNRVKKDYGFSPGVVMLLECVMLMAVRKIGGILLEKRDGCLYSI